jgi:PTS system mannose-specific IIA component
MNHKKITGILIISHEQLGANFLECITHILGEKPQLLVNYAIAPQDDPDIEVTKLQEILKQLDQGNGVLILTDLYGATPANIARRLIQSSRIECLAGLNVPMLLRALQYRHEPLSVLINKVSIGGREGIIHILPESDHAT